MSCPARSPQVVVPKRRLSMSTVLVTGATGCVGANIVEALLARGYSVRALRRVSSRLTALDGLEPELVIGDIMDVDSLRRAMSGCEVVFHLLQCRSTGGASVDLLYQTNVAGTRNVLDAARAAGSRGLCSPAL